MLAKLLRNYLRFYAKLYLAWRKPKIIAVSGSVGKTSTKEAIFEVLKVAFGDTVRKSEGNLNTKYGTALAILGFKEPPVPLDASSSPWAWLPVIFQVPFKVFANSRTRYLVLEIAADQPGDIEFLSTYIKPDIAVITNIGSAHLEIFGSLKNIIKEKTALLRAIKSDGWAIYNTDDQNIGLYQRCDIKTRTIGIKKPADFWAKNIISDVSDHSPKTIFEVENFKISLNTFGEIGNVYAALFATAVADLLNISRENIIQGLELVKNEKHRMQILTGKNDSLIIDDAYNANPLSMRAALETLKKMSGKKIAVLGGMLELGEISESAHREIGEIAAESADEVISVGDLGKLYGGAKNFSTKEEAIVYLLGTIKKGDIILIKASRGIGLEAVVEAIKN